MKGTHIIGKGDWCVIINDKMKRVVNLDINLITIVDRNGFVIAELESFTGDIYGSVIVDNDNIKVVIF